jgi:hypothetical protein
MSALAAAILGIVIQNQVALRTAPRDSAPQQSVLWQGEVLELRGEKGDYLNVYDHRLERGGYVRASQVRAAPLSADSAPGLLSVMRFLRDTPGNESLGISYAAAYLRAVPTADLTAEPLDALGVMADRLAQRASSQQTKAAASTIAAHLEVVSQQGIGMRSIDTGGHVQICYDGEMFRRVLAMASADPAAQARAALGLTRHECLDPNLGPTARYELDQWRADVLDRVSSTGLSPALKNRLHMRRAGVLSAIVFWQSRHGENAQPTAERALEELAAVSKSDLDDEDQVAFADAAVRVGASRLAALPAVGRGGRLIIRTAPGAAGETCVMLFDVRHDGGDPLARRCTFGTVWPGSAMGNTEGTALTLGIQSLATWRELWVFRQKANGWSIDVLPPGTDGPDLGYAEAAGWVPGSRQLLVVREVRAGDSFRRRFEFVNLDTLLIERWASTPDLLRSFARWQDPLWRSSTVALR